MAVAALLALGILGPVAFAVLSLRSTFGGSGASTGAWIVVGVLLLAAAVAAAVGGAAVAFVRWLVERLGRGSRPRAHS